MAVLLLYVLILLLSAVQSANWKQLTGEKAQNTVYVPEYPFSSAGGWGPRWGSAAASDDRDDKEERQYGPSKIFVIGGDDYNKETGLGGLHNDVYASEGELWKVYQKPGRFNKNGDEMPRVVSRTNWRRVVPDKLPPSDYTYRRWTMCDSETWGLSQDEPGPIECEKTQEGPGFWKGKTRFSPRRNHAAVVMKRVLYVIGGRANEGADMPEHETLGGIYNQIFDSEASRARDAVTRASDDPKAPANLESSCADGSNFNENCPNDRRTSTGPGARGTRDRDKTTLVNDVWASHDGGSTWTLANPGCLAPQKGAHRAGATEGPPGHSGKKTGTSRGRSPDPDIGHFQKAGAEGDQCLTSSDCFGDATCQKSTYKCVCEGPSPRERHSVTLDETNGRIYLYGGFVDRRLHNCGVETVATDRARVYRSADLPENEKRLRLAMAVNGSNPDHLGRLSGDEFECGGGFRGYMSDVWYTNGLTQKGGTLTWRAVQRKAPWAGRGEHVSFIMEGIHWIAGGRTGHSWSAQSEEYLNDVWFSRTDGRSWEMRRDFSGANSWQAEWSPRGAFAAVVIPKSVLMPIATVYLFGGKTGAVGNETFLNDVWSWNAFPNTPWVQDYSENTQHYAYVSPEGPIEQLRLKESMGAKSLPFAGFSVDYVTKRAIGILNARGIRTVRQLANLTRDEVLDIRLNTDQSARIEDLCDMKTLAQAVVRKCTSTPTEYVKVQSELNIPVLVTGDKHETGEGLGFKFRNEQGIAAGLEASEGDDQQDTGVESVPVEDDAMSWEAQVANWDGCEQIGELESSPNDDSMQYAEVNGYPQVQNLREPWRIAEWLTCRQVFAPRAWHAGVRFQQQVYLVGGKAEDKYFNDMWVRDPRLANLFPITQFTERGQSGAKAVPSDQSSDQDFYFQSDKSGCVFEWRLEDYSNNVVVRNWTTTAENTDESVASNGHVRISWLSRGFYRFRVRAVDAAGNRETTFREGENQHTWFYVPPIPWLLIIGILAGLVAFALAIFLELRRRRRKAAMYRYAIKRMRRKFKGAQKGKRTEQADWKKLAKVKGDTKSKKKKKKKIKSGEVHHKHKRRHKADGGRRSRRFGGGGDEGANSSRSRSRTRKHKGK